jgi:hypothetical protein
MALRWLLPLAVRTIDLLALFWFLAAPVAGA